MRYIVVEGLPAVGKSETLALLSRFYPKKLHVLPELVKEVALNEGIEIFSERRRLTEAIIAALPRRRAEIEEAIAEGKLCLEESHLGVHLAYSQALGDKTFVEAYEKIQGALPKPDFYLRLEIPISVSIVRQKGRKTPGFFVDRQTLARMLTHLKAWHLSRKTTVVPIDADRPPSSFLSDIERALRLTYIPEREVPNGVFRVLLLLGRPASGKSEFIDFMEKTPLTERATRYHIGDLQVIDDFPILWEKFREDDLWERLGRPRLSSRPAGENYAVTDPLMWAFLIEKIDSEARKVLAEDIPTRTLLIEFSRGREHGYAEALSHLSSQVLSQAAILYLDVSFKESWRRNLARYDEARRDGILTHSVPWDEMKTTYETDDWKKIAPMPHGRITVHGIEVPYVTLVNEPESTDPGVLAKRYGSALDALWEAQRNMPS